MCLIFAQSFLLLFFSCAMITSFVPSAVRRRAISGRIFQSHTLTYESQAWRSIFLSRSSSLLSTHVPIRASIEGSLSSNSPDSSALTPSAVGMMNLCQLRKELRLRGLEIKGKKHALRRRLLTDITTTDSLPAVPDPRVFPNSDITQSDVEGMTVSDLRIELALRGLKTKGKKEILRDRLLQIIACETMSRSSPSKLSELRPSITQSDISRMKVATLRKELEARGLDARGNRAALRDRLLQSTCFINSSSSEDLVPVEVLLSEQSVRDMSVSELHEALKQLELNVTGSIDSLRKKLLEYATTSSIAPLSLDTCASNMSEPQLSKSALQSMNVTDLREQLKERGLETKGSKDMLKVRLLEATVAPPRPTNNIRTTTELANITNGASRNCNSSNTGFLDTSRTLANNRSTQDPVLPADNDPLSIAANHSMKVSDLRKQLEELGLDTKGSKDVLKARLFEATVAKQMPISDSTWMTTDLAAGNITNETSSNWTAPSSGFVNESRSLAYISSIHDPVPSAENSPLSIAATHSMKVSDLRKQLEARGLDTKGSKDVLKARLFKATTAKQMPINNGTWVTTDLAGNITNETSSNWTAPSSGFVNESSILGNNSSTKYPAPPFEKEFLWQPNLTRIPSMDRHMLAFPTLPFISESFYEPQPGRSIIYTNSSRKYTASSIPWSIHAFIEGTTASNAPPVSKSDLTRSIIMRMRVPELRTELARLGLETKGKREILRSRLVEVADIAESANLSENQTSKVVERNNELSSTEANETNSTSEPSDVITDHVSADSSGNETSSDISPESGDAADTSSDTSPESGDAADTSSDISPESGDAADTANPSLSFESIILSDDEELINPDHPYVLQVKGISMLSTDGLGVGIILSDPQQERDSWTARKYFKGNRRGLEAEYSALILGLRFAAKLGVRKLLIQTDSEVLVKQLMGEYPVSKETIRQLYWPVMNFKESLDDFQVEQIRILEMASVQNLAEKALITGRSFNMEDSLDPMEHQLELPPTYKSNPAAAPRVLEQSSELEIDPTKTYKLMFDGGARGNERGGLCAGAGMVIYDQEDNEVWCGWKYLGQQTNNVAEYSALLLGLQCANSLGIKKLEALGDSELIIKQFKGEYRVRDSKLKKMHSLAKEAAQAFDTMNLNHVFRKDNQRADFLANQAMDNLDSYGFDEI